MNLLLRADASITIGTGHVMRCLALAQAWQDAGGRAAFAMAEATPATQARLSAESCEVVSISHAAGMAEDASQTIALAGERESDWIVVDGYQFTADYQRALKAAGFKVLFLDDYGHAQHYFADLVLNQNASASADSYLHKEAQTRLLLGPKYCLLRREFAGWGRWQRDVSAVCHRALVMMGGSDPENLTARVIEALALARLDGLETTVVIGGSNPHFVMLQELAAKSGQKIRVQRDILNMAEPMAEADVAISAAGSTCWELCLMGLPALLVDVADNQTEVARELDRRGCAIRVGDRSVSGQTIADQLKRLAGSHELRQSLSQHSRELVDAKGAVRVVSVLRGHEVLRLRRARIDDMRLLWEWANDPDVRAASFSSATIPWETHVAWFTEKLGLDVKVTPEKPRPEEKPGRKRSLILIAENENATPLGQIRFDVRQDGEWEVDVSVDQSMRRRGMASQIIRLGVQTLVKESGNVRVHAFVKAENVASVKAFERASFMRMRTDTETGRSRDAVHLIYPGHFRPGH
jgi:UDP-2,4-diacetamido-2,4,6-trideoxy-beta-L-altropyranose hydrolase